MHYVGTVYSQDLDCIPLLVYVSRRVLFDAALSFGRILHLSFQGMEQNLRQKFLGAMEFRLHQKTRYATKVILECGSVLCSPHIPTTGAFSLESKTVSGK